MKEILSLLSALLIVTGIKAQKIIVQKETIKPKADTLAKNSIDKQSKAVGVKGVKIAPVIKKICADFKSCTSFNKSGQNCSCKLVFS